MKIRLGHVSNSSSSSFTCDICKRAVSGWDMGLDVAEMHRCENGHLFCDSHAQLPDFDSLPWEEKKELLLEYMGEHADRQQLQEAESQAEFDDFYGWWDDFKYDEIMYNLPARYCPICQFEELPDRDIAKWAVATKEISRQELVEMLREQYDGDYKAFAKDIS